jgi:hypothetical protein
MLEHDVARPRASVDMYNCEEGAGTVSNTVTVTLQQVSVECLFKSYAG